MPGRPNRGAKKRLTEELQAINRREAERNRAATGDPRVKPPATGKPFDSESAKKAVEARKRKEAERAEEAQREAEALAKRLQQAEVTVEDRAVMLERLRELAGDDDAKVAKDAAKAILDIYSKENQDHGPSVVRYESAFIDPEAT